MDGPFGIEVDLVNSLIYWSEVGTGGDGGNSLSVGNLDGSGSPTVLFCSNLNGINDPRSIAINFDDGLIFWVELGSDAIKVGNLDGSGTTDLLFSGSDNPAGLAIGGNFVPPVEPAPLETAIGNLYPNPSGSGILNLDYFAEIAEEIRVSVSTQYTKN